MRQTLLLVGIFFTGSILLTSWLDPEFEMGNTAHAYIVESDPAASGNDEYCVTRKRLTAPEEVCVPLGRAAAQSALSTSCDPNLGSRAGMGVDDELY